MSDRMRDSFQGRPPAQNETMLVSFELASLHAGVHARADVRARACAHSTTPMPLPTSTARTLICGCVSPSAVAVAVASIAASTRAASLSEKSPSTYSIAETPFCAQMKHGIERHAQTANDIKP
eukprot:5082984-Pleurochrysis_carterae.AAC.3